MLVVMNAADDTLWNINPDDPGDTSGDYGSMGSFPSGFVHPNASTWAPPPVQKLFVSDSTGDSLWNINPFDTDSLAGSFGNQGRYPTGITKPRAMAWAERLSWLMVIDYDTRSLWNINPDDPDDESGAYGSKGIMPAGIGADAMAWADTRLLVGDSIGNKLWNINPFDASDISGAYGEVGAFPAGLKPAAMSWRRPGLSVADSTTDHLWNINPDDPGDTSGDYGDKGAFPSGLTNPRGMAWIHYTAASLSPGRFDAAVLLEFVDMPDGFPGTTRFWSGTGDLSFEAETWTGGVGIIQLSAIENTGEPGNRRATATLPATDPADRARLMQDWGPFAIEIGWIRSTDRGATWSRVPMRFKGRLSEPRFVEGALTVTIETHTGDVDRGRPLYWSHDAQRARHPGDDFFEYTAELEQGQEIRWPP